MVRTRVDYIIVYTTTNCVIASQFLHSVDKNTGLWCSLTHNYRLESALKAYLKKKPRKFPCILKLVLDY